MTASANESSNLRSTESEKHVAAALQSAVGSLISVVEMGIIRVMIQHDMFDLIPDHKTDNEISIKELSKKSGMEESLLRRFCACLVANGLLISPAPGRVAHTDVSRGYRGQSRAALHFLHAFDNALVAIASFPDYFTRTNLKEPSNVSQTPWALAIGHPGKTVYEIFEMMPERSERFNRTMAAGMEGMPIVRVYDFSWINQELVFSFPTRPLLVDVGGGKGQSLKAILDENPHIPASQCVLQDRVDVINEARNDADPKLCEVKKVVHSFFDEQPIREALVYFIRRVLNDWPDEDCIRILSRLRAACADDSRILISEQLLPDVPSATVAALDIFLMTVAGKRRTAQMYGEIAAKAGFQVRQVYQDPDGSDTAVIELSPI